MKRSFVYIVTGILLAAFPHYAFSPAPKNVDDITIHETSKFIYSNLKCSGLSFDAFETAYTGFRNVLAGDSSINDSLLTLIDFSLPSSDERLYVIDLKNYRILTKTYVAHGMGSGMLYAREFSNRQGSHMSSLGFYLTEQIYSGSHGISLKLTGLENGINDNAMNRAIVMHGAHYAEPEYIERYGRLGRSFGCPALPYSKIREVISLIARQSCLFIYSPDKKYLASSEILNSGQQYFSENLP